MLPSSTTTTTTASTITTTCLCCFFPPHFCCPPAPPLPMILVRELLSFLKKTATATATATATRTAKEQLVFVSRITTLQVHHAFLYVSLLSLHVYEVKMPHFTLGGEREHKATTFFFFPDLRYIPSEFNSRKISQHLIN